MTRAPRFLLAVLIAVAGVACGDDDGRDASDGPRQTASAAPDAGGGPTREIEIDVDEIDGSGVTGSAHFESVGSEASKVVIELEGAPDRTLAVHTHEGPCEKRPTEPTHTLEPIEDGRSESTIAASVQGLTHGYFALLIHDNENPDSSHVACGQIGGPPSDE